MNAPLSPPLSDDSLWLVRTVANRLSGPMTQRELKAKIMAFEVGLQDEVCPSEGYWFFLHERPEVEKWLKIDVPKPARPTGNLDVTKGGWDQEDETATDTQMPAPGASGGSQMASSVKKTAPVTPPASHPPVSVRPMPSVANREGVDESVASDRVQKLKWFLKEFGFVVVIAISLLIFAGFRLARLN